MCQPESYSPDYREGQKGTPNLGLNNFLALDHLNFTDAGNSTMRTNWPGGRHAAFFEGLVLRGLRV